MKVNNAKEYCIFPEINNSLELKHSYKEIQKIKQNEEYENTRKEEQEKEEKSKPTKKEILNSIIYFFVISIIPIVVTVLLIVKNVENIFNSISAGIVIGFVEWFISCYFQVAIKDNKANKFSYEKMQYIPLTEGEQISLNIHNICDYISFLNDFLTVDVKYFSYFELRYVEICSIGEPSKAILDEINKSLKYLDERPEGYGYISFINDKYVYAH